MLYYSLPNLMKPKEKQKPSEKFQAIILKVIYKRNVNKLIGFSKIVIDDFEASVINDELVKKNNIFEQLIKD